MEEKTLNAIESLKLIESTIEQSRNDIAKASAQFIISWGVLVIVTSLVIYGVNMLAEPTTDTNLWHLLWIAMTVIGMLLQFRMSKQWVVPESIVSKAIGYTWGTFGVFVFVLWAINICVVSTSHVSPIVKMPMAATILLLMGVAVSITGLLMKHKFIAFMGAGASIVCSYLSLVNPGVNVLLYIAITGVFTLLIPGLYLKFSNDR